jgi:protein TonB
LLLPPPALAGPANGTPGSGLRWSAAWLLALSAHAAVLYALMREPADLMPGGGGQQIEAISVTLVHSFVLESRDAQAVPPTAAAQQASVEANDGGPHAASAPAAKQQEGEKEERDAEGKEKPKEEPVRAVAAAEELPLEEEARKKQEQSTAAAAGGAAVRSDAVADRQPEASAPAAASAGAVREYGRHVALALSKTKPKGLGTRASVQVTFTIATDGGLALAEVTKSSGYPKLDDAAIEAVRRTKFPAPPAGMTTAQLTYQVPYHFR